MQPNLFYLWSWGSSNSGARRDRVGHLASGVPGAMAGLAEAQRKYGRLTLAQVMAPAIRLAEEGFSVYSSLWRSLRSDSAVITRFADGTYSLLEDRPSRRGSRLVQTDLAV
ncbi:MAG: gamma-glutamyltransferase [Gemmatimonadaceae bacterium]|nr:gamma-glutamyltransferase [Gemmatimonadaceae bacterium]